MRVSECLQAGSARRKKGPERGKVGQAVTVGVGAGTWKDADKARPFKCGAQVGLHKVASRIVDKAKVEDVGVTSTFVLAAWHKTAPVVAGAVHRTAFDGAGLAAVAVTMTAVKRTGARAGHRS